MAFLDTIRKMSAAIAFAEAGEFDTARAIAQIETSPVRVRSAIFKTLENYAVAAALAEEGLHGAANDLVRPVEPPVADGRGFLDLVGLQHATVHLYVTTR